MNLKKAFGLASQNKLVIRFSDVEDVRPVSEFYNLNTHQHVDQRKPEVLKDRAEHGRVILVVGGKDPSMACKISAVAMQRIGNILHLNSDHIPLASVINGRNKPIGFSSIAYDFSAANDNDTSWVELGSTIAVREGASPYPVIKGVNLYPFIISSQVVHEFLANPPKDKFIANVYDDNPAVIHMLTNKAGWSSFTPSQDILLACKATKGEKNEHGANRNWYHAETSVLPHNARLILDTIREGETQGLLNKKTQERIKLDVSSFSLANEFRQAVEELAYGEMGQRLENSPHMGMANARNDLQACMQKKYGTRSLKR